MEVAFCFRPRLRRGSDNTVAPPTFAGHVACPRFARVECLSNNESLLVEYRNTTLDQTRIRRSRLESRNHIDKSNA